ncbi:hypothetical protein WMO41_05610 [Ventrimonas sp. CLA-AP-H27]|uniref:Methyl-accepting chemotaxis protein n=1 Tax=Ventrimonas faecis TaxID=3133170 RepID=A0ABV1HK01_9FIRM
MKKRYQRLGVMGLAAVMACTGTVLPVLAGQASVAVDENMYVNLDYYGNVDKVNVVKGCDLNGQTTITDYGNYTAVTNMSDYTEPVIEGNKVTWNVSPDYKGRFYYKGELDAKKVALPWNFDVSYKLNGVPKNADELAGASGLIEIHIDAKFNDSADVNEYYKNNFVLAVAVMVDTNDCYSLEADGAQKQTIGSNSAVVFTALPGEDGDFTVRIGTDSFETSGVFMAMTPLTGSDLEHVTDLKDAKDTWKESGDEMHDSMQQMALSVEAMRDGINSLQNGMNSAESARQTWSGAKDSILEGNDRAIETLSAVSDQLEAMIPHIETAKEAADTAHDSLGDIVDTVREMQDPLNKLHSALKGVKSGSEDLAGGVSPLNQLMQTIIALDAQLQASEQIYVTSLASTGVSLQDVDDDYYIDMDVDLYDDRTASPSDSSGIAMYSSAGSSAAVAAGLPMDMVTLQTVLGQKTQKLQTLAAASNKLASEMSSLLDDVADTAQYTSELTDSLEMLTEDTAALYDSMDSYYPDLQASLDDTEELMNRTTEALNTSLSTAAIVQNTLKNSSDNLDAATRDSIRGTLELLDKSLSVLDSTASIRHAGVTMKEAIDKEWDDLDGDTRFLNMDPNAEKISFTSDENQEPESVQIILRTAEISLDDDDEVLDAESEAASQSPLRRIWNVLVKMWKAFVEIFKNR